MGIQWIEYKGNKVLYVDYSGIKMEREMVAMVNQIPPFLHDIKPGEKLLVLVDLNNCYTTPGFIEASKKLEKEFLDQFIVKRAVLGVTGPKAVLLKGYNIFASQKLEPFTTKDAALEFLVR